MNGNEANLVIIVLVAIIGFLAYSYRSSNIPNWMRDVFRDILKILLIAAIFWLLAYTGFSVLHFDVSQEWTQTVVALTLVGAIVAPFAKAVVDKVFPK